MFYLFSLSAKVLSLSASFVSPLANFALLGAKVNSFIGTTKQYCWKFSSFFNDILITY